MKAELKVYEEKMQKTIHVLEDEFNTIRAGRANPHVLDQVTVDYYGQPTAISQVGNINIPEARLLQITPWDKSMLKVIEKAISMSDIGINPQNDGICIRLSFPELTEERRKDLTKEVKKKGEEAKVAIRNIRRDANDHFKRDEKAHLITEDELKELETKVQKVTDDYIKNIDRHVENKNKEILTV
jgi:ribosome recycling factor